jgi:protein Mpv17
MYLNCVIKVVGVLNTLKIDLQFLFPFKDWWGVPIKVAFDQTIWSGFWNSVYFVTLGILRFESPQSIASELKATFWPMLSV